MLTAVGPPESDSRKVNNSRAESIGTSQTSPATVETPTAVLASTGTPTATEI